MVAFSQNPQIIDMKSKIKLTLVCVAAMSMIIGGIYFLTHIQKIIPNEVKTSKEKTVQLPLFSDYLVKLLSTPLSSLPSIKLDTHPSGSQFKTRITQANKETPNFAGKYSIVIWGCGTSCQAGVIIDRSTGIIIGYLPFVFEYGYEAKIDSSLLIVNPYTSDLAEMQENHPMTTYYAKWDRNKFELVGAYVIKKNSIEKATGTPPTQL